MRFLNGFSGSAVALIVATVVSPAQGQLTNGVDRNISRKTGDDSECAIAKNPLNHLQLFVLCNTSTTGLFAARSTDNGLTWIYPDATDKTIADGDARP